MFRVGVRGCGDDFRGGMRVCVVMIFAVGWALSRGGVFVWRSSEGLQLWEEREKDRLFDLFEIALDDGASGLLMPSTAEVTCDT